LFLVLIALFIDEMMQILYAVIAAVLFASSANARLAGECATLCNDLRYDVLTMAMCK